jgi:hypothetical protein
MKVVKIKGGLGNQMFQYAFAKNLENDLKEDVKLDFHQYRNTGSDPIRKPRLTKFQISLNCSSDKENCFLFPHKASCLSNRYRMGIFFEKTLNKRYFFNKGLEYINPQLIASNYYYDGYWQSYKYVENIKEILVKEFVPNYSLSEKTCSFIKTISSLNSVFIGVRKGDYTKNEAMLASWGSFSSDYYRFCMEYIKRKTNNPLFIIFSNDIDWCKTNLDFHGFNYIYRENADIVDDFEELQIMSSCSHAIIVNSTFNWWGAWLMKNESKIICCPKSWFFNGRRTEILPSSWIRF